MPAFSLSAGTGAAPEPVEQPKPHKGFFDKVKGAVGHLAGDALSAIDVPRAALVATGKALGQEAGHLAGKAGFEQGPSLRSWFGDVENHIGAGQVVEDSGLLGDNQWAKRAVGGALDLGADPLNAVSFGSGEVAKEGLEKAGQVVGDATAKSLLRQGGVDALRQAVEEKSGKTFEEVLSRGTGDLGKQTAEEHVQDVLKELAKNGKGGFGVGGVRTGLGQGLADRAVEGIKSNEAVKAARGLFNPVAGVEAATGSKGAAEATSQAMHTGAIARREARAALADAASQLTPEEYTGEVAKKVARSMGDDLVHDAPEIASKSAKPGWKQLADTDTFVHPAVADALKEAISTPPSKYVDAFDKVNSAIKQLTVFGPLNGVQHDAKRTLFNHLAAVMYGGATDPSVWKESWAARKAVGDLAKEGEAVTAENLVKRGMEEGAAKRAESLYHHVLGDNPLYEVGTGTEGPAASAGKKAKGVLGTRTAQHVAEVDGELSRGAVYLKALDDGLSPAAAAAKSRKALLDFSSEGLTKFERDKLQRLVFFYKFPRRAIPAAVGFTLEHPGEAIAASKLGAGVAQGARNKYGQALGLAADTPLEAGLGDLGKAVHSPGQFVSENINPLVKFATAPDTTKMTDVLPPLGQLEGKAGAASEAAGAGLSGAPGILSAATGIPLAHVGNTPLPAPGFSRGTDSGSLKEADKKQAILDKISGGQAPTQLDRLKLLADVKGISGAYSMKKADLLAALQRAGAVTPQDESKFSALLSSAT